jgi:hypothetical protein
VLRTACLALLTIVALLLATGCRSQRAVTADPGTGAAATADPFSGSPTSAGSTGCDLSVGAQLRERTVVDATGRVSMLAGDLPCPTIGIWVARFRLDEDPTTDPAPTFVGSYSGRALALKLAAGTQSCSAGALLFALDAPLATAKASAVTAARLARNDLARWPADRTPTVPGGAILAGRGSVVLVGTVTGDPAMCSPGGHVSHPLAAVGDCWLASTVKAGGPVSHDPDTRFTKVSCNAPHTHEVYWVETLSPTRYRQETERAAAPASSWARKRADTLCAAKRTAISLAHDVAAKDIFLEFQWPSTLRYPPSPPTAWTQAQVVCLARWKDGKPSDRHLLHR